MVNDIRQLLGSVSGLDRKSMEKAKIELNEKMKPQGSLGILEEIAIQLSGIYGFPVKENIKKCHIVVTADNGIVEEGISSCPLEYTRIVSEAMLNGIAAIGILTKRLGIELNVIDIGIAGEIHGDYPNLYRLKVKSGTNNFYKERAITRKQTLEAIETGMNIIKDKGVGLTVFSNGEMGIGNTSTSSAVLYSFTRGDIDTIVGRGGGLSDTALVKKKKIIVESCERYNTFQMDPIDVISYVGGLDIACMVGMYLGAVKYKNMMLVDGFISAVAALAAYKIEPKVRDFILATHMSEEPGMKIVLNQLRKKAFLNMKMRLGEGTGAVFAYSMVECALDILNGMKSPVEVYKLFS